MGCGETEQAGDAEPWSGPFDAVVTIAPNPIEDARVFGLRREPAGTKLLCTGCRFRGLAPDGLVVALSFGDRLDLVASDGQVRSSFPASLGVSWSRDGAHAVVLTEPGSVFIVGSDGSGPIALPGDAPLVNARWSPDSQFLAIETVQNVAIWGPSGTRAALRQLPTSGGEPDWAPDSAHLAVLGMDPRGPNATTSRFAIDRIDFVDRDGASTTTIKAQDLGPSGEWPEFSLYGWSPDSAHYAFELTTSGPIKESEGLRIVNARGEVEPIHPGSSMQARAAWSPRASILAFQAADAPTPTLVLWSPEREMTIPLPANFDLTWSPDGSHILATYASATTNDQASLVEVATGRVVGTLEDRFARWSPDGSHLAISRYSAARPTELLVSDASGENPVLVANDVRDSQWMNDSRYLLVAEADEIFAIRFDGEDRRVLLQQFGNAWPTFAPSSN